MSQSIPLAQVGCLISIEGADGVGKSTQHMLLCGRLRSAGEIVTSYDFPHKTGSPIADLIGDFLKGHFGEVTPEFLALAFSLDRLNSREQLLNDFSAGNIVVCDRYVSSNVAFQGAKLDDKVRQSALQHLLYWLEYELMHLPKPKMEIVLTADERYFSDGDHLARKQDLQRAYIGSAADIHENAKLLQIAVNSYYMRMPEGPQLLRMSILDETRRRLSQTELHERIWEWVSSRLLQREASDYPLRISPYKA